MVTADYPFEGRLFDQGDGFWMHVVDEGPRNADPILMLHGNPTWSFYYRRVIERFSRHLRCVAPDHIGCGRSDKPPATDYDYSLAQRVQDLDTLVRELELDQITLMVHDWGGMIGFAWAAQHPERIKRLIVTNTAAFTNPQGKKLPWELRLARTPVLGSFLIRGLGAFSRGANRFCSVTPLSAAVKDAYLEPYDSWDHRIAVQRFVADIPVEQDEPSYALVLQTERALSQLARKPTKIYWGMRDFVFDEHFLATWQEYFPHAAVTRFENAGHYLLEDAHQPILDDMESFLLAQEVAVA